MSKYEPPTGNYEQDKDTWGHYEYPGDIVHMKWHNIFCAILFLIVVVAFIVILIFGLKKGKPWMLYRSWDSDGQYCGMDNSKIDVKNKPEGYVLRDYTDFPYTFFGGPDAHRQICVKECPTEGSVVLNFLNSTFDEAIYSVHITEGQIPDLSWCPAELICPPWFTDEDKADKETTYLYCTCPYKSQVIFNRCIPVLTDEEYDDVEKFIKSILSIVNKFPGISQALMAFFKLWVPVLVCSLVSIVIAYIWVYILRCVTSCIVYFVCIAIPIAIIALGIWLFFFGENFIEAGDNTKNKYCAYACWGVAAILIVIIIFLWKRLKSAIATMKLASKAMSRNFAALFAPFISILWILAFYALIILSCVFCYASGEIKIDEEGYMTTELSRTLQYLIIYNLVFLVFISAHIYFTNYYAVSGTVTRWYFLGQKGTACGCFCFRSFFISWTKGLGTIAVTTFIMTPLYLILILLKWAEEKAKDKNASKIVLAIIKVLQCCCICITKIMKYLNKNVLTVHQVYNCNWMAAAKITVKILMGDIILTGLINGITTFVLFLSKLVVAAVCTFIFVLYVHYSYPEETAYILPAAVVFILAFIISAVVVNIYDNFVDIIFACFLSDKDITNEGAKRPMYAEGEINSTLEGLKKAQSSDTKVESKEEDDQ